MLLYLGILGRALGKRGVFVAGLSGSLLYVLLWLFTFAKEVFGPLDPRLTIALGADPASALLSTPWWVYGQWLLVYIVPAIVLLVLWYSQRVIRRIQDYPGHDHVPRSPD